MVKPIKTKNAVVRSCLNAKNDVVWGARDRDFTAFHVLMQCYWNGKSFSLNLLCYEHALHRDIIATCA